MAERRIELTGIEGLPEIRPGDDLAALLASAAEGCRVRLRAGDVLVIAQKVVSKAESRLVDLDTVAPSPFAIEIAASMQKDPAMIEVVLRESRRIVRMDQRLLIVETRHGFVCANAGVDASNVPGDRMVSLLPLDPDASAAALRKRLRDLTGVEVAIIISDTFGRPWREGLVNVAIGVAGLEPLHDFRGQQDPYGYTLHATVLAAADELAAAAGLVMGKVDRIPAVLVRGFRFEAGEAKATALIRPPEHDLFR
jgi:coenzyme F420-0:L-glutamate ligase/coenzyme F420-1:gamma-L-glutamate ligase